MTQEQEQGDCVLKCKSLDWLISLHLIGFLLFSVWFVMLCTPNLFDSLTVNTTVYTIKNNPSAFALSTMDEHIKYNHYTLVLAGNGQHLLQTVL